MKKVLSVIIPCYNHGQFIEEAIESVYSTDNNDKIEVIIINDGSTDENTIRTLSKLDYSNLIIINQNNQGLAKARNNGILRSHGDYVLILDADNSVTLPYLADFFYLIENNIYFDALYGNRRSFGSESKLIRQGPFDIITILKDNYIDACAIFKKSKIIELGLYDFEMPCMGFEDWDLWLRLGLNRATLLYIDKTYFNYRIIENSMLRSLNRSHYDLTRKYLIDKYNINQNLIKTSIESFINYNIDYKTVILLLLKKLKIYKNFIFKIT